MYSSLSHFASISDFKWVSFLHLGRNDQQQQFLSIRGICFVVTLCNKTFSMCNFRRWLHFGNWLIKFSITPRGNVLFAIVIDCIVLLMLNTSAGNTWDLSHRSPCMYKSVIDWFWLISWQVISILCDTKGGISSIMIIQFWLAFSCQFMVQGCNDSRKERNSYNWLESQWLFYLWPFHTYHPLHESKSLIFCCDVAYFREAYLLQHRAIWSDSKQVYFFPKFPSVLSLLKDWHHDIQPYPTQPSFHPHVR